MDDKRSGAVRFKTGYALKLSSYKGKWKRRFVVLTPEALHWFKVRVACVCMRLWGALCVLGGA